MSRTPTRISKHGYDVYEQDWNKEVHDYICANGVESALLNYSYEEVVHHLGGEAYGAKIDKDTIVTCRHFQNPLELSWSALFPAIAITDSMLVDEICFTLSKSVLIVSHKRSRLEESTEMWNYYQKMESTGKDHATENDLNTDSDYTPTERTAIKDKLAEMNLTMEQEYAEGVKINQIYDIINSLGFTEK